MSFFSTLFDVFSRRPRPSPPEPLAVPEAARMRIYLFCNDIFGNARAPFVRGNYVEEFWSEIHKRLQFRHGQIWLTTPGQRRQSVIEDAIQFVMSCRPEHFLDFLEDIFKVECYFHVGLPKHQVVEELNQLIRVSDLPFFITPLVEEEFVSEFHGAPATGIRVVHYPQVVLKTAEVVHAGAIAPALEFLRRPAYATANTEYLAALEDFRARRFGDAVVKSNSAFESVMKIVCKGKGWPVDPKSSASSLLKTILPRTTLEPFFEQVLLIVATIRNRLSPAHGGGADPRVTPPHIAEFVLNSTASCILLLVKEVGEY
jgi:hypothetical protein